jgi:hypothetical protein
MKIFECIKPVVSFFVKLDASHFSILCYSAVSVAIIVLPFALPFFLFFLDPALG